MTEASFNDEFMLNDEETKEVAVEMTELEPEEYLLGVVSNCKKLNVREAPSKESDSLGVIACGTEVMITPSTSTEEFYSVCTESGIEGFCVKQFINLKE